MIRCGFCCRWFGRHRPFCKVVNPIGWIKHQGVTRFNRGREFMDCRDCLTEHTNKPGCILKGGG